MGIEYLFLFLRRSVVKYIYSYQKMCLITFIRTNKCKFAHKINF
jgi:hypothetical protein